MSKRKISVKVSQEMYEGIRMVIENRKEKLAESNPPMREWDDQHWARAFEQCSVSGVVRDAIRLLIEKEAEQ